MCGIAGYFGQGSQDTLERMTKTLTHRGPDDQGINVFPNCGFGFRRLSIIDLSKNGAQPMSNEDKSAWIVFNGEIYNFKELKNELKQKHAFKSRTDTEVILHLYEEIGENVFEKLNGMFALAIYDAKHERLILARDRMGEKPLYYGIFNNTLIFASEIKALIEHPEFKKKLDLRSLNKYFQFEYVPAPNSIFQNIQKLLPGHYLTYEKNSARIKKFWDINFKSDNREKINEREALDALDKELERSVKMRLVSDVPLGIFLSGGIDSSTIAYYAQKNNPNKIKTFSIIFDEKTFDESKYARMAAKFLGTEHHEEKLNPNEALDLVPKVAEFLDEPMADPSLIPTYLLCKFTRKHVTVAVSGDGGDELFCGYDTFLAHKFADLYARIPKIIRKEIIERIAYKLPTSFSNISFDFKIKKFLSGFDGGKKYRDARWMGSFSHNARNLLFSNETAAEIAKENEFEDIDWHLNNLKNENYFNQLIYLYMKLYLADDILVKTDRASMFNSLEVRAPFLDHALVDFVSALPVNLKLRGTTRKYILKKLMRNKLPHEIIYRKKKGFGIPAAHWLQNQFKNYLLELFNKPKLESHGILNYIYVNALLLDHFSKKRDNRKQIWTLMIFQLWYDRWYK